MELSKDLIKKEIDASKAAVKANKEGAMVNEIVLKAFEEELKKCVK